MEGEGGHAYSRGYYVYSYCQFYYFILGGIPRYFYLDQALKTLNLGLIPPLLDSFLYFILNRGKRTYFLPWCRREFFGLR